MGKWQCYNLFSYNMAALKHEEIKCFFKKRESERERVKNKKVKECQIKQTYY